MRADFVRSGRHRSEARTRIRGLAPRPLKQIWRPECDIAEGKGEHHHDAVWEP